MKLITPVKLSPPLKKQTDLIVPFVYAGIITVVLLAQLFLFEEFFYLFRDFGFFGLPAIAMLFSAVMVVIEFFALPFALYISGISKAMRNMSMICGWLVPFFWMFASILLFGKEVTGLSVLDKTIDVQFGWFGVLFSLVAFGLAVWTTIKLCPSARNIVKRKK